MGSSRISPGGLPLPLFCCLVVVGVAGLAVGPGWAAVPGPATSATDVGVEEVTQDVDDDVPIEDESLDSTPSEDAQTTETATPEETPTPSKSEAETAPPRATPASTDAPGADDAEGSRTTTADGDDEGAGTPESDESDAGADGSDGTNATDADEGSRDRGDFEDATVENGTDEPDGADAGDAADAEARDDAPEVESRSRRRMPDRGPERGTIVMAFDDVPVSTISFTTRRYGNVTVDVLDGLPSDVEGPAGDRLSTLRISVPDEVRDSPAKVTFTVDVATLDARGVPNDAVWLAHHDPGTGEWDRLETRVVHASDQRVVYVANTPGFSLFSIQGDSSQVRSPVPSETTSDTGAPNDTAVQGAEAASVGGLGLSMGVVLFMGAVSVATTVFGARRVSSVELTEDN